MIYLLEDDSGIRSFVLYALNSAGFEARGFELPSELRAALAEKLPELLLLDIMLPGMDGFSVCERIRKKDDTPIFILSAKGDKSDKLNGLMIGADDYLEKPFDIDILLAKIAGVFKRRYSLDEVVSGDLRLNKSEKTAFRNEKLLEMTPKEFELLQLLVENAGKTLTKDFLFNRVWGSDSFSEQQTLTVHIKWLREKIENDPKKPVRIQTVWGVGYKFV
jgi:DNA-binding response OmpR family regulator